MSTKNAWPTISISEADYDIVKEITGHQGILRGADAKEILMIAAALALDMNIPAVPAPAAKGHKKDIIHQGLLRSEPYDEYRQYMLLIYYYTAGQEDLKTMSDFKAIVDNFIDYASRGLQFLKTNYLKIDGSEQLEDRFAKALGQREHPLLQ